MANIFDVASYILNQKGEMTAMKLQKLCYYSQAWNLAWEEYPLFQNRIEAWDKGPVSPDLYDWHRGELFVKTNERLEKLGDNNLTDAEIETINEVLNSYSDYTAQQLSELSHKEAPWKDANSTCANYVKCNAVISHAAMHEYYSSLICNEDG